MADERRFTFDLHPVATVLGGLLAFPFDRGAEVLRAFREWAAEAPDEATLLASIMTAPPEPFVPAEVVGQKMVVLLGCWCGDPADGENALAPLRALGLALDHFGPMPYPVLQGMLDGAAPRGLRNYYRGGYLAELTDDVIAVALHHGARLPSPLSQIHFHQMGGAVGRRGAESAFSGRDAGYTYNLLSTWADATDDLRHTTANRALAADLAPHALARSYVDFEGEPGAARTAPTPTVTPRRPATARRGC
jgi:hypothetical protein